MEQKELDEETLNNFMQKMVKKSESLKTMVETSVDDTINNFVQVIQQLWRELDTKKGEIESLNKKVEELKNKKKSQ